MAVLESEAGPAFVAGCVSAETRTLFEWHDFLGLGGGTLTPDNHKRVTIRVGAAEAVNWYLPIANNKTSTFINDGLHVNDHFNAEVLGEPPAIRSAEDFLRSLVQASRPTLVAQTTPYNESPLT